MKNAKRIIILILAVFFFLLGVVGLLLPLVPQVLFFAIAVILFSILSPSFRAWMDKHTIKYPKVHRVILKVDSWIRKITGEV